MKVRSKGVMAAAVGGVVLLSGLVSGCGEQLLTDAEARSQYDRNDAARERRAPAKIRDARGENRPNIRGRVLMSED